MIKYLENFTIDIYGYYGAIALGFFLFFTVFVFKTESKEAIVLRLLGWVVWIVFLVIRNHYILSLIDTSNSTHVVTLYFLLLYLYPFSLLYKILIFRAYGEEISYPKDFFLSYIILMVLITPMAFYFNAQLGGHLFS